MKQWFLQIYQTFLNSKPEIKFLCANHLVDVIPKPVEASRLMPDWFKSLSRDREGVNKFAAGTVKRCVPALEAMSQGYIIPLWADLHVVAKRRINLYDEQGQKIGEIEDAKGPINENHVLEHVVGEEINGQRVASTGAGEWHISCQFRDTLEVGAIGEKSLSGHTWDQVGEACDLKKFELGRVLIKFTNPWVIETTKGWSVQIKNPANNFKWDICLLEGVVDTDTYHTNVNFPFVWTGNEEGEWIIPKGTPLAHVIPFKRESVKLTTGELDLEKLKRCNQTLASKITGGYRSYFWHKRKKANLD